jgi:hypothetical protein
LRILKSFPARLEEVAQEKGVDPGEIEISFADEARIGQKNKITRRWARRGTRPSAPMISVRPQPTSSALSVRAKARARLWFCPPATQTRWAYIWPRSPTRSNLALMRCCSSIRPAGICRRDSSFPRTSPHRPAAKIARAQSDGKHLAIRARQLALKPHLRFIRRYPGALLRSLEQAYRAALEDHVHRSP